MCPYMVIYKLESPAVSLQYMGPGHSEQRPVKAGARRGKARHEGELY